MAREPAELIQVHSRHAGGHREISYDGHRAQSLIAEGPRVEGVTSVVGAGSHRAQKVDRGRTPGRRCDKYGGHWKSRGW